MASIALLIAVAGGLGWMQTRPVYATGVGEVRLFSLQDGSQVRLDTDSRVSVRYARDERRLVLDRGRALFTVATDRTRPFVVDAGRTTVTALGTRFDVRRERTAARVTLLTGVVEIRAGARQDGASWRLSPGEQLVTTSPSARPRLVDVEAATSWAEGRLTFRETSLPAAVAEVNRYSRRRIDLDAPGLSDVAVTGVFNTGDTDAFVAAAEDLFALRSSATPDGGVRLTPRSPPS
jgi:transmembrane sensor